MRQLLFVFALLSAVSLVCAAETSPLTTNSVVVGEHGTLEIVSPRDWTLLHTNLNLPGNPLSVELHEPTNAAAIRLTIFWDGFAGRPVKPTEADMEESVSNGVTLNNLHIAVEKTFQLEKLHGPGVTGCFARLTDAGWTPVVKDEFPNIATGMFRSGNLWGNFDLLTFEKNGPMFKAGLKIMESLRRKP
jgi:hypothetical protein